MSLSDGGRGHAPRRQSFFKRLLLSPLGLLYRLWNASIRIKFPDQADLRKLTSEDLPLVIMLWHNRLFIAGEWHLRFRKKQRCYGLISGSRDGAWLETFYGWARIRAIRGSRNRRGAQAMRDLVKVVREGHDVGITPDGSRGPRYEAKPGALALAKITKSPVLLLSFSYSRAIRLKSWDRFVIPLPFSSVRATTRFLEYEELFGGRSLDEATRAAEKALNELNRPPDL